MTGEARNADGRARESGQGLDFYVCCGLPSENLSLIVINSIYYFAKSDPHYLVCTTSP